MDPRPSVLITGASRGIGRTLALHLASRYRVFAGVRKAEDAAALMAGGITPLLLDVREDDSVRQAAIATAAETEGRGLNALINNAATLVMGPVEQTPLAEIEDLFQVNVHGVIRMVQHFTPLLRTARGRLLNMSSVNGRLSFPLGSFYCASKFAVEALSDALRVELRPWGIHVIVIQPGPVASDMRPLATEGWQRRHVRLAPSDRRLYEQPFQKFTAMMVQMEAAAGPAGPVLDAVDEALTAAVPRTRYVPGAEAEKWIALASHPDEERDQLFVDMLS